MKLAIKKAKHIAPGGIALKSVRPFFRSEAGLLVHRPRDATLHNAADPVSKTHIGVNMLCGLHCSTAKNSVFLDVPPVGQVLCEKCELVAQKNWLPSANELAGRNVQIGGLVDALNCRSIAEGAR